MKSNARLVITTLLVIAGTLVPAAQAQHDSAAMNEEQNARASSLIRIVRNATEKFKDVSEAEHAGYHLLFGCVTGPDAGAMGLHYVNQQIFASGIIDAEQPQIVIYEPTASGRLKLIGADYLVLASQWDKAHPGNPPQLMGQLFHYFEAPNRFGLPAFYTLHVWAWKDNPKGAFVNWHPDVSCKFFNPGVNQ